MEILPFLYLGSAYHAARRDMLDALGITALLNVSSDCPNHFEGHYQYKCIPVEDNHKADISSWFMEAIEYIGEWLPSLGLPQDAGAEGEREGVTDTALCGTCRVGVGWEASSRRQPSRRQESWITGFCTRTPLQV